jgi:hypothetical protein
MTKKLVIVAALMTFCGGAIAQDEGSVSGGGFLSGTALNTNNKFQISLMLGNANLFNQDLNYVLPKYGDNNLGLGNNNGQQSVDPGYYLGLNNLGENASFVNMAGLQFAYYITDGIDVNLSFGMDLRSTPKKDYVENEDLAGMNIQGAKWIEGRLQNNWIMSVGGNYHFTVSNEKIDLFAGVRVGYQHGQLTTVTPFTDREYNYLTASEKSVKPTYYYVSIPVVDEDGNNVYDDYGNLMTVLQRKEKPLTEDQLKQIVEEENASFLYEPRSGAGQVNCINTTIVAGVNYQLTQGLYLGVEFAPWSLQYSMLEVCPKGNRVYQAAHTANRFFANPMMKLGFRF